MTLGMLIGVRLGGVLRRGDVEGDLTGLVGGSAFGVVEFGVEGVGVVEFAADVHGEFEFPTQRFDDAGGGDLFPIGVVECHFNVGSFLKGGDLEVNAEAVPIGPGLGAEAGDVGFFGDGAGEVVFGEEKVHAGDYNRLK